MPIIVGRDGQVELFQENGEVENETENRWNINGQGGVEADWILMFPDEPGR